MNEEPTLAPSDRLRAVAWSDGILRITVPNQGIYDYHGVPSETATKLMTTLSQGDYFNQNVKGRYDFTQLLSSTTGG